MNPASARLQAASQSGETLVWYSARIYRPTPFSSVMIMHRQRKWRRPQTAPTDSGRDVGVKTQRNASQSDHSTIFPPFFPGSHHSQTHISMSEGEETQGEKNKNKNSVLSGERRPSVRTVQETGLSSTTAAFSHPSPFTFHPVIYIQLKRSSVFLPPSHVLWSSTPFAFPNADGGKWIN